MASRGSLNSTAAVLAATLETRDDLFEMWERWGLMTGLGFCDDGATRFMLMAIKVHLGDLAPSGSWIDMAAITVACCADQALLCEQRCR